MAEIATGVLKLGNSGAGVLRDPARSFQPNPEDVTVPNKLVQRHRLPAGAQVVGPIRRVKRDLQLAEITSICGLDPEVFRSRKPFSQLTAVDPDERFNLSISGEPSMRIIDLVAPIGKGTRGMIVSPPKAGKTTILKQITQSIRMGDPKARIIVLLVDERPEEVTDFRRSVDAEVLASTSDRSTKEHVELAELVLAHVRLELECGHDVVVLVDSLTRIGRNFNMNGSGRKGRTMSGGLDSNAMEIPRRFFGLARNIEDGGSVTILATALIDTGSRMDELIFEEFKGTGNSEIVLDRSLADQRLFPAINLNASGTRKEHLLYGPEEVKKLANIRRALADRPPKEVIVKLLKLLEKYPTNEDLLDNVPG